MEEEVLVAVVDKWLSVTRDKDGREKEAGRPSCS